jgi:hypothetical protein
MEPRLGVICHWFAKVRKNSKFFCAQRIEKRPTDSKAFLHKVLSNGDDLVWQDNGGKMIKSF